MGEFKFFTESRVRFCETDLQGILHHSHYLKYFEVGRVEYLRNLGLIENSDFLFPCTVAVVESSCNYYKTLKWDDHFRIYARVTNMKGASFLFEYKLIKDSGEEAAFGTTRIATVDRISFKPVRIPDALRSKISAYEEDNPLISG